MASEVGVAGFEPATSALSGQRSNQLSYTPFGRSAPRKEVIQPQVPLRLPCYDFTPVTDRSLVGPSPCGLRFLLLEQPTPMV
jgi:hypothetical protein